MGFNKVYQNLVDIFPQIDQRILKAVAIENSKDVDAAAEIVLSEILPLLSKKSMACSSTLQEQSPRLKSAEEDAASDQDEGSLVRCRHVSVEQNACSSSEPISETCEVVRDNSLRSAACEADIVKATDSYTVLNSCNREGRNNESFEDAESEELILLGQMQDNCAGNVVNKTSIVRFDSVVYEDDENDEHFQECADIETKDLSSLDKHQDSNSTVCSGLSPLTVSVSSSNDTASLNDDGCMNGSLCDQSENCDGPVDRSPLNGTILRVENFDCQQVFSSSAEEHILDAPKSHHLVSSSRICSTDSEREERNGSVDHQSMQNSVNEMADIEDDSNLKDVVIRSNQICKIDVLEQIVEDAKNNKKTLFQAMQSVMNMMREVELKEKAAEQAKEEAARGGLDTLIKVEELKKMLVHAKEANDMHAGEVYGEKAILATEARELQSRLLSLSEERDKSLAILDEMCQTLEARQAAAEEVRTAAELEKLEREKSAQNALAEQEAIMEKVVQESKILQQEAEENSKLREFLMDRGQIVDSLQGEISVICQDVRLLKEKFDERVPLSKSISSSQTSCILASSGSSLKSMASDLVPDQEEMANKTPDKTSPAPSVDGQPSEYSPEEDRFRANHKELLEDGWEFFDNEA